MNNRLFYLDAMRGILMMLGVVLHSAQVFNPEKSWLVYSDQTSIFAEHLIAAVHLFRMPAFFVVSGFFCMLTMGRYGITGFLKLRIQRILVPLIATGLTFNVFQTVILNRTGWANINFEEFLLEGAWVSHLWFLNYLLIYFLLACGLQWVLQKSKMSRERGSTSTNSDRLLLIILMLLPLYTIGLRAAGKLGLPLYWDLAGIIQGYNFCYYFQFFLVGLWLQTQPDIMKSFSQTRSRLFAVIFPIAAIANLMTPDEGGAIALIADEYAHMLLVWCSVILCFNLFYSFTNRPSRLFRYLADAAYSVYLVHHLIVILLAIVLIELAASAPVAMPTLIVLTFILSLLIHSQIIQRSKLLTYAFNGK
ncbi:acyltransferase family protein [Allohahella sp. A8]|uniref:acyltransferase family protein n=1 Tax=Allohahella sp. A8 TaxID=3141461 RepID=UPI003A8072AE